MDECRSRSGNGKFKLKFTRTKTCTSLDGAVKIRFGRNGLAATEPVTITEFFDHCAKRYASKPALASKTIPIEEEEEFEYHSNFYGKKIKKPWVITSYREYAKKVEQAALVLTHIGLQPRSAVGILADNSPEWLFLEFGILQAGGIVFGVPPASSPEALSHMFKTTEATICIVDSAEQMDKLHAESMHLPRLKVIIHLHEMDEDDENLEPSRKYKYFYWNDLLTLRFGKESFEELERRKRAQFANECAMIVFTPSTSDKPKGVLLSHDNVVFNAKAVNSSQPYICCFGGGRVVSYLPLSHIAAQAFDVFASLLTGACVFISEWNGRKGSLVQILREVKPTMFFGIPMIYEELRRRWMRFEQTKKGSLSEFVENNARDTVTMNNIYEDNCSASVNIKDTFAHYIVDNTRKVIGMECCKLFFCGGAPLAARTKEFFVNFDVGIIEVFWLSELAGPATINRIPAKCGSFGAGIDGTKLRIRKSKSSRMHGEIIFYGRNVFMGYLHDPIETAKAIDGYGWLQTGFFGSIDREGHLNTIGKLLDIIITADGNRISARPIEEALKRELPAISHAMIVGNYRQYITVVLTLKTEVQSSLDGIEPSDILHDDTKKWLESLDLKFENLSALLDTIKDPSKEKDVSKITESIMSAVERVNARAWNNAQHIQKFLLLRHDFTIANGELAPSLRIRRQYVLEKYAKKIEEMYS